MPDVLTFIVAGDSGKPTKGDRRLIRSRCMLGKNKREDSRRSRREAKRTAAAISSIEPSLSSDANTPFHLVRTPASDLELMLFPVAVDHRSREMMFRFLAHSGNSNLLYPVERCLDFRKAGNYLEWMSKDIAFLHSVLLTTSAITDFNMHRSPSTLTSLHLRNTLRSLNMKLSENQGYSIDSIIFIIMTLAITAALFEDHAAERTHIQGLQQIIMLRGGHEYLRCYPKVHFKIERLDLSRCLSTGCNPVFFPGQPCWDSYFLRNCLPPPSLAQSRSVDEIVDPELAITYRDLQGLATLLNENNTADTRMRAAVFQGAVHAAQSRLLYLQDRAMDDLAECLRLGMLALLATTLKVPGRKISYAYLARQLRQVLPKTPTSTSLSRALVLWAVFVSIVSIFEATEPWIQAIYDGISEPNHSWSHVRTELRSVIWVDCVHDEPAHKAFLRLSRKSHFDSA